jgi:hypothetical protein
MDDESVEPKLVRAPVGSMVARVAGLWRSQGPEFLEHNHVVVEQDVDRLRHALIIEDEPEEHDWHDRVTATVGSTVHSTVDRLHGWDQAVIDRMRARRAPRTGAPDKAAPMKDAVVDLTGPEPVVTEKKKPAARRRPAGSTGAKGPKASTTTKSGPAPKTKRTVKQTQVTGKCDRHPNKAAKSRCRKCGLGFCNDCLVGAASQTARLCVNCALVVTGIRRHPTRASATR